MQSRIGGGCVKSMRKERNLGIDLLRIYSMHMIVLHHVLDLCGFTGGVELFSINYTIVCLTHGITHCAVNTYALISGYVYVDAEYKLSNIIKMWLQVLFYTVGILIVFAVLAPEMVDREMVLTSLFPMLTGHYWYFTQYVGMFFFIPVLNLILNTWSTKQFKNFFLVVFVLFSCINIIVHTDLFHVGDGFSMIWLTVMYLIGGYIKKSSGNLIWSKKKCILIYIICTTLTAASRWIIQFVTIKVLGKMNVGGRLMIYTSPTMLFAAIALLIIFSNLKIKKLCKTIRFLGPLTFGVYIIHINILIARCYPILGTFLKPFLTATPVIFVGVIILLLEGVYLACSLIDFGRLELFRLLRINEFSERVAKKVFRYWGPDADEK